MYRKIGKSYSIFLSTTFSHRVGEPYTIFLSTTFFSICKQRLSDFTFYFNPNFIGLESKLLMPVDRLKELKDFGAVNSISIKNKVQNRGSPYLDELFPVSVMIRAAPVFTVVRSVERND